MSFRAVFIALVIAFGLVLGGMLINSRRPEAETRQPTADLIKASGKCAECHMQQQYSVVHEYQLSQHAQKGVNCLECHRPAANQEKVAHHDFEITRHVTAANCRSCHEQQYQQFVRSRHALPSWAAVYGEKGPGMTPEMVAESEKYHPAASKRPEHPLVAVEGISAGGAGCAKCHAVGRPNADGSIGNCTDCHARHTSSVALARLPSTCGQCHMGPDHSQIEIYEESRHGVLFVSQQEQLKLDVPSSRLTTRDMFIPTCATCHMSGLNGLKSTHDTSERLSYWLAAAVSDQRPNHVQAQAAMKEVCAQCHTQPLYDRVYTEAEKVVQETNDKVKAAEAIVAGLRKDGLLSGPPFSNPIEFIYFDLWHYYGRTVKHGAFMGGADFTQWHGNYPLLSHTVELKAMADELRRRQAQPSK
jgi:hydroxylamine dehydrogenase